MKDFFVSGISWGDEKKITQDHHFLASSADSGFFGPEPNLARSSSGSFSAAAISGSWAKRMVACSDDHMAVLILRLAWLSSRMLEANPRMSGKKKVTPVNSLNENVHGISEFCSLIEARCTNTGALSQEQEAIKSFEWFESWHIPSFFSNISA